jgi:hypothetical protein
MKHRLTIVLSATAIAVAGLGSLPIGHAADVPEPAARAAEPFVPFVTDFPRPAAEPVAGAGRSGAPAAPAPAAAAGPSGIDWVAVGIGAGAGAALAALVAGSGLALTRRARLARS